MLGANLNADGSAQFRVWASFHSHVTLKIGERLIPMEPEERGYFSKRIEEVRAGTLYTYLLSKGQELPDPVSRSLPLGIEGPSEIIDPHSFEWSDHNWQGIPQNELIFYECHVGTFTQEGTFQGVCERLCYLKELGITCLELMPVATFPGRYNWGYDGASLYAPHYLYGGEKGLKKLVNAAHAHGIAVCLDVVYNHVSPEGAYLTSFAPYLTDKYQTPWGKGMNYDGEGSDEVKRFMLQNALYWIEEYHIDALRLDALHALFDYSPNPFLRELSRHVEKTGAYLIAESDLNDSRLIRPRGEGGVGFHGWWNEDFHHALHAAFTGEQQSYYSDYKGIADLKRVFENKVLYQNRYSSFRKRSHGNSFQGIHRDQLVVFAQNHDQIGNRPFGNRLSTQLTFEALKTIAVVLLLAPFIPLLFMGEEYGENHPFEYFIDYATPELRKAVYEGRKKEFPFETGIPVPDFSAFQRSHLSWQFNEKLLALYKKLIILRRTFICNQIKVVESEGDVFAWEYKDVAIYCNLGERAVFFPELPSLLHTNCDEFGYIEKGPYAAIFRLK